MRDEIDLLENPQIMRNCLVIESKCAADLRVIGQLTRESRRKLQQPWDLTRGGDTRNVRDVSFDDRSYVLPIPIPATSLGSAFDCVRISSVRNHLQQPISAERLDGMRQ